MGFDMVSMANNHTGDYGPGGVRSTTRVVDEVGLMHAGTGENLDEARAPGYLETPGGRVALISAASTFPDGSRAGRQGRDVRGFKFRDAGSPVGSTSGRERCPGITAGTPAAISSRNGTSSLVFSRARSFFSTGRARWESTSVSPCPGKCFRQVSTPPSRSPLYSCIAFRLTDSAR